MSGKIAELEDFEGCYLPREFALIKERIEHFDVRNDDVWVTSYPKSGTTWTQEMVWLIVNNLDYEAAKVDLDQRFPFLETNPLFKSYKTFLKKINSPSFEACSKRTIPDSINSLEETKGRRFIKTHLPWHLLPRQITDRIKTPKVSQEKRQHDQLKVIHIMRNPKQISISYYHHYTTIYPYFQGNLDEFIDLYIEGKMQHGCYFKIVKSYLKQQHLPNLLLINYEEMHDDLKGVIRKVSEFLGKNYTEEDVEKLAHHLSFGQMKQNKALNKQDRIEDENVSFMRSGTKDDYKHELTDEIIEKLDEWVLENAKGTGLPYENKL